MFESVPPAWLRKRLPLADANGTVGRNVVPAGEVLFVPVDLGKECRCDHGNSLAFDSGALVRNQRAIVADARSHAVAAK